MCACVMGGGKQRDKEAHTASVQNVGCQRITKKTEGTASSCVTLDKILL